MLICAHKLLYTLTDYKFKSIRRLLNSLSFKRMIPVHKSNPYASFSLNTHIIMQNPLSALISLQNVMFDNFKPNLKTGKSITIDGDK